MATTEDILNEVITSDPETDVIALLEKNNIAWRSFSQDVWMEIAQHLEGLTMSDSTKAALQLRLAFMIRYCGDLEITALPPVESPLETRLVNQVRVVQPNGKTKLVRGFTFWAAAEEAAVALEKEHPDCDVQLWTRER